MFDRLNESHLPVHLAVSRSRWLGLISYDHHFLVEEINDKSVTIIQNGKYCKCVCISSIPCTGIHRTSVNLEKEHDLFDFNFGVYIIENENYPKTAQQSRKALDRAQSRIGENRYQLSINNCEHFVTFALTGKPYSIQLENSSYIFKYIGKFIIDYVCDWKISVIKLVQSVSQSIYVICEFIWDIIPCIKGYIALILDKVPPTIREPVSNIFCLMLSVFIRFKDRFSSTFDKINEFCVPIIEKIKMYAEQTKQIHQDKLHSLLKLIQVTLKLGLLIFEIYQDILLWQKGSISGKDLLQQIIKRVSASAFCAYLEKYGMTNFMQSILYVGCIKECFVVLVAHMFITILVPAIIDWLIDMGLLCIEQVKIIHAALESFELPPLMKRLFTCIH